VVHGTGGLLDTVVDCTVVDCTPHTLADGSASGFVFHDMTAESFAGTLSRVAAAYDNKRIWRQLQKNGMLKDFSWRSSASSYRKLYLSLLS